MDNRIKVERGIRYREHPTRKHGVPRHLDRYYVIRLAVDGIMRQEALGWESEGITLEKARLELAKLREARRTGKGPRSLAEKRELAENKRKAEEEARRREALANISLKDFWDKHYWPAQKHKAEDSLVAEESLFKKWIRSAFTFNISLAALRKKWWKSGGKITERREMAYGVFCNIMIFLVELDKIELTAS